MIQYVGEQEECLEEEFLVNNSFFETNSWDKKCSNLTLTLSSADFMMIIPWPERQQKQLTITISKPFGNLCYDSEMFVVVKLISSDSVSSSIHFDIALLWRFQNNSLPVQWTVWEFDFLQMIHLYIGVNAHIPLESLGSLHFLNIPVNTRNHTTSECDVHVQHMFDNQQTYEHQFNGTTSDSDETFCLFSTCYTPYTRKNASWNSTQTFCQQYNQSLLTINSDIEANFIEEIIFTNLDIYYCPVIFLNMKQDEQVI